MADSHRTVGQTTVEAARLAKALFNIIKAAIASGLKGAAVAAAKEFAPQLIKLAVVLLIIGIAIPMVVVSVIPNIFFGFDSSSAASVSQMSTQARMIGTAYMSLEQFEDTEIDAVVTSIVSEYTEAGQEVDELIVQSNFAEDDLLWFIAITSVASRQDLNAMNSGGIHELSASRLNYGAELKNGTLTVTISKVEPEQWMEQLGFDEEARAWARGLHETLEKSGALEKYAELYEGPSPGYSGDTSYSGRYTHGDAYENVIDVSGLRDPSSKNAHDLAAYAIQAWENNWGYVWGTFGTVLTRTLYDYKIAQYPEDVGRYGDYILEHYLDRRTTDCIGLVKGYGWLDTETLTIQYGTNGMPDYTANQMYENAVAGGAAHGPIASMPEVPGLILWKSGHTGVYIGNGYAIEAMGTLYGVVKTEVAGRGWQAWYKLPAISYED